VNRRRSYLGALAVVSGAALISLVAASGARAVDPVPGSQGTDTALPATDSHVTVHGRGAFADLAITVNQTRNLTDQAVSLTWAGGQPTLAGAGRFNSNFLQIMQCWGDDDGTNPENPGPPPEQCEQGAAAGLYGGVPATAYPPGFTLARVISRSDWPNFDPAVGVLDTRTTNVWMPFRAVDGTVIGIQTDPTFLPEHVGGHFWLNTYYDNVTTNEVPASVTLADGRGSELFEVLTGVQSSGLGCGQKTQPVAGGGKVIPKCWLVIVPRGTPAEENAGTPFGGVDADQWGVMTSPVSPAAWQNRIAIPIEFNPLDSPCSLAADTRPITGSELALPAVLSWEPMLCGDRPPFVYGDVPDSAARQQLVSKAPGAPGMVVVSKPLPASTIDPAKPVVYAPLTLSGLTISFNIERNPTVDAPPAEQQLNGIRVAQLNLTPRVVAKLLTQSYAAAVSVQGVVPNSPWLASNPRHMGLDPDFLRFNPEFNLLQIADGRTFSGLQLPEGNSDAAEQLWAWILSDPEARAWLDGQPDEWGMKVNPVYATTAAANSNGIAFANPLPNSYPKADPTCYQAPRQGSNNSILPPVLCGTDWMPYQESYAATAKVTRVANDGAKIANNPFALTVSDVWKRDVSQYLGRRDMLAVTDLPSATQFGVQMAQLSRAGDDSANRSFVAPNQDSLLRGLAAMVPAEGTSVLVPSHTTNAPGAYPLAMMTYAAVQPLALDANARADFATFIDYAAANGQVSGSALGQLPLGFAPLPDDLRAAAAAAADQVRNMQPPAPPPATTTTTTTVAPTVQASPPPAGTRPQTTAPAKTTVPATTVPPETTAVPSSVEETTPTTVPDITTTTTTLASTTTSTTPAALTSGIDIGGGRYVTPALGVITLGSALGALEITKRPRRRVTPFDPPAVDEDVIEP
jgi:hypothetical protein